MTVHSETERDRGVSLARLRSADKTGRTTLCLATGGRVPGRLQRIDGGTNTGCVRPHPMAVRDSAVEDQCILVKFGELTGFVFLDVGCFQRTSFRLLSRASAKFLRVENQAIACSRHSRKRASDIQFPRFPQGTHSPTGRTGSRELL